jgi:hypothetical protein
MKAVIASSLLAIGLLLSMVDAGAAASTVTGCKVAGRHCAMRCRHKPYAALAKRCLDGCNTTQGKCIQQAYKDIELGKVPPPIGDGAARPGPRQSEEDKKNAEMGRTTPPSGGGTAGSRQSEEDKKNIELGKTVPPSGGGNTPSPSRQSEEDKKNAEMGKTTPRAGRPGSSLPLPCASWQVRYSNDTCGCPSGMRGSKCEEIILH